MTIHAGVARSWSSSRFLGALAALIAVASPAGAAAQHQHHHHGSHGEGHESAEADAGLTIHAGLGAEVGRVESFGGVRDYQGISLMAGARRGRFELMAHVPFYRIELGANTGMGLGDVHVQGRWIALAQKEWELGVSAGLMPPFGDDEDGLAMGHWMVMAGAFGRAQRGRASGSASVGYGGALGGNGHAEHGVTVWPPVNPMNAHEIRATADVGIELWRGLGARVGGFGAVPIGEGDFLAMIGAQLTARLGRAQISLGARHGLAANPLGFVIDTHIMAPF